MKQMLLAGLVSLSLASFARAGMINVDFNSSIGYSSDIQTHQGAAVLGMSGDVWNGFDGHTSPGSNLALVDADGAATSVLLSFTTHSAWNLGDPGGSFVSPFAATPFHYLMRDYLYTNSSAGTQTVELSGLVANAQYDLYLYSNAESNGRTTAFTVNGVTQQTVASNSADTFIDGVNYVKFSTSANASGELSLTFAGVTSPAGNEGNLNGFQLVSASAPAVPEPSTFALLGIGGIALVGYGWRRKQQQAA